MTIFLRSALAYASRFNWRVFPLKPNEKTPLVNDWPKRATIDPLRINEWWAKWPDANIGIACGPSGLVVIDCDVKNPSANGIDAWRELLIEQGFKDDTIIQLTPSGGEHFIFSVNGCKGVIRNSSGRLGPGIDVRAEGGYIVAAPSVTGQGKYQWDAGAHPTSKAIAPIPPKLAAMLLEEMRMPKVHAPNGNNILAGQRNDVLTSLAGSMRRHGMTEPEILAAISTVNEGRCQPPLPFVEVQRIASSVSRYEPATVGLPRVWPLTDLGNAERLAAKHGNTLRYCHAWGVWLAWNGQRWQIDDTDEVVRRAKETVREVAKEAELASSDEIKEAVEKWAKASESRPKIMAMIDLAQADDIIPIRPENLDAGLWLLNAANGVIDLESGELLAAKPDHLITKMVPVNYDATATCKNWLLFLDRVMAGDGEMIDFLRRVIGYTLTGSTREQCIFILYGTGANGKSTFLETISALLNDYACRTPTETLLVKRSGAIPNDVARLKGARLVTAVEADQGRRMAESMVKQMTGGERVTARFLNREWFEFNPEFKIFLATNHKPEITGTDYAIWRRVRMIPFSVTIPEAEQDKDLLLKLREELPGILAWAVQGCIEWQITGLNPPATVLLATKDYQGEMDVLAGFLDECCIEEENVSAPVSAVYQRYTTWAGESGEKPVSKREFGIRMKERGMNQRRGSGGTWLWQDLALREGPSQKEMELS